MSQSIEVPLKFLMKIVVCVYREIELLKLDPLCALAHHLVYVNELVLSGFLESQKCHHVLMLSIGAKFAKEVTAIQAL
jgi:hypothetical protein